MTLDVHSNPATPMLPKTTEKTAWSSIYIAGLCAIFQSTQFSIFFASMWPYILTLQHDVKQNDFGIVVALYSFSQCVCSPLFGYWSNKIKEVRLPLIVGFCIMAFGNLFYLSLQFWNNYHLYVMMAARFTAGAGTGNMSLLRAYVSTASNSHDRSRAIAFVSGGIALGSMLGPALQILFSTLGAEGVDILGFNLSIYTSPALFCLILNIFGLSIVIFLFNEKNTSMKRTNSDDGEVNESKFDRPDNLALFVCIATRFIQIFLTTTIESIGSAYSMMMFSFEKEEAVEMNAISHTVGGVIAALLYVSFIFTNIRKYLKMRLFTVLSITISLFWFVSTYPYPFYSQTVKISVNGSDADCDSQKYNWCETLTRVPIWNYYSGYVIVFGTAFSILNITTTTLFSKIIGQRPQGTYQGFYQMSGSVGRLTAPIMMSATYTLYGPKVPWVISMLLFSIVILMWIVFRNRMIPFDKRQARLREKNGK
ncbi:unnamed protein product [Caenorhabditis bovis]|uniref:Major facilitator superfamily (MFS) profile domain-containing protein n=1 Tax=Caenorhabditis bovis TaxID=2654633 RepID=A0A8S1ELB5_9PELO|nr:unnamed protein product [Caenorhabditis bovis]